MKIAIRPDRETVSMSNQPSLKASEHNPRTIEEAQQLVKYVESLFMPWNIDALVDGFTDDCIVRFGTLPEFRGKEALRNFFTARSSKQSSYRLTKQFRTLVDDTMTNIWDGEWEDKTTGRKVKGFGVEVWKMRDGKIAIWEAAFNSAPAGETLDVTKMLG